MKISHRIRRLAGSRIDDIRRKFWAAANAVTNNNADSREESARSMLKQMRRHPEHARSMMEFVNGEIENGFEDIRKSLDALADLNDVMDDYERLLERQGGKLRAIRSEVQEFLEELPEELPEEADE